MALRADSLGSLSSLSDGVLSYILSLLDPTDLGMLACTSKVLRVFSTEEPIWMCMALRQQEGYFNYQSNWRRTTLLVQKLKNVPLHCLDAAEKPVIPVQGLSSDFLHRRWCRSHMDITHFLPSQQHIPSFDASCMRPEQFRKEWDIPCRPAILQGLTNEWPVGKWNVECLNQQYGDRYFQVSKPHGGRVLMKFADYRQYMWSQHDEDPLYIFDGKFGRHSPELLHNYTVPRLFDQDYYSVLGSRRPPFRWVVIGPVRSGAAWHVDPAMTSAWNALVSGRKRWALYPPGKAPPGVRTSFGEAGDEEDYPGLTPLQWFLEVYTCLPPAQRPLEVIQNPGDVIWVPGGWWHCVLNLEESVAVTQNFVSDANLAAVIHYMAEGKQKMGTAGAGADSDGSDLDDGEDDGEEDEEGQEVKERSGKQHGVAQGGGAAGTAENGSRKQQSQHVQSRQQEEEQQQQQQHKMNGNCGSTGGKEKQQEEQQQQQLGGSTGKPHASDAGCDGNLLEARQLRADRKLGRWLYALWREHPEMREKIWEEAVGCLGLDPWHRVLQDICKVQGLGEPERGDVFPLIAATSIVFLRGAHVVKVSMHQTLEMQLILASVEAAINHRLHTYLPPHLSPSLCSVSRSGFIYAPPPAQACGDQAPTGTPPPHSLSSQLPAAGHALTAKPLARPASLTEQPHPPAKKPALGSAPPTRPPGDCIMVDASNKTSVADLAGGFRQTGDAAMGDVQPGDLKSGACNGAHATAAAAAVQDAAEEAQQKGDEDMVLAPYLVLSKISGDGSMRDLIRDGTLSHAVLCSIAEQLGELVAYIHHVGVGLAQGGGGSLPTGGNVSVGGTGTHALSRAQQALANLLASERPNISVAAPEQQPDAASDISGVRTNGAACGPTQDLDNKTAQKLQSARAVVRGVLRGAFWHDRDGNIWTQDGGWALKSPEMDEEGTPNVTPASEQAPGTKPTPPPVADEVHGTGSTAATPAAPSQQASATEQVRAAAMKVPSSWQPFASYLQWRRLQPWFELSCGETLPSWLLEKLEAYLPVDVLSLIGSVHTGEGGVGVEGSGQFHPLPPPCFLHGDLSGDNVVISGLCARGAGGIGAMGGIGDTAAVSSTTEGTGDGDSTQGTASGIGGRADASNGEPNDQGLAAGSLNVHVLDFGDSGFGDPLYELVPLYLSTFRGDRGAMQSFFRKYVGVAGGLGVKWPSRAGLKLSYCAMVYTLLYEEDAVSKVFRVWPALRRADSLEEMAVEVWGWLDGLEGLLAGLQ